MNGEHFLRHVIGGQLLQDFQKTGQKKGFVKSPRMLIESTY